MCWGLKQNFLNKGNLLIMFRKALILQLRVCRSGSHFSHSVCQAPTDFLPFPTAPGFPLTIVLPDLILLYYQRQEALSPPVAVTEEKESIAFSEGLITYLLTLTGSSWVMYSSLNQ